MNNNNPGPTPSLETTPLLIMQAATGPGAAIDPSSTKMVTAGRKLQNLGSLTREDFDGGPISLDEIVPQLYLGNLSAATHMETLKLFKITHILTLDSVPLPQHILEASFLTSKYVHVADMPKEDILHHLDHCVEFIQSALDGGGTILVHCYFGVSRSSAVIIAYIMKSQNVDYPQAFEFARSKRRFVQPNPGFVAQLKLYKRMGCKIDPQFPKYKLYRLRMAGEQVRKVKILPQCFNNLIKPDPAITQENPEPIVYRCRKCRRVLASKSHLLVHQQKIQSTIAADIAPTDAAEVQAVPRLLDQIAAELRKTSLWTAKKPSIDVDDQGPTTDCRSILFVEPIAWMKSISHNTQGRLNCPKCDQKLGNFSWINGCQCPCGEEVWPAFYFIPSKVELSKAVQNVQTTV